ncbi:Abi family protein [Serratia nevei]|uniref:Abi family protein n=1 Tax=Serratia nevei TaxID=2703794 RepID=UPI00313B5387
MTVEKIITTISLSRLESYKTAFSLKNNTEALGMYVWNKKLCGEFLPILQLLEVSLRNSIYNGHIALQAKKLADLGIKEEEIATNIDYNWLQNFFLSTTSPDFSKTQAALNNVISELNKYAIPITPDNIVSKISFGVWSNICTARHEISNTDSLRIWPDLLQYVFPGKVVSLAKIESDVKQINYLRNRIAHHEPIWKKYGNFTLKQHINSIINDAALCVNFINYINPSNLKVVELLTSLQQIEHLCKKETIDSFLEAGKNISSLKHNDIQQWIDSNIQDSRINGKIFSVKLNEVIVQSQAMPGIDFILDKHALKSKKITKKTGKKINFEPIKRKSVYMATKVIAL